MADKVTKICMDIYRKLEKSRVLNVTERLQILNNSEICYLYKLQWKYVKKYISIQASIFLFVSSVLKVFSSRTSCPNSIKLGTHYPWVNEIQVCSNKGPGPLLRGDNYKNVKMGWGHLKIFSRTTGLILTRLGTNHPWGGNSNLYKWRGFPLSKGR